MTRDGLLESLNNEKMNYAYSIDTLLAYHTTFYDRVRSGMMKIAAVTVPQRLPLPDRICYLTVQGLGNVAVHAVARLDTFHQDEIQLGTRLTQCNEWGVFWIVVPGSGLVH